MTKGDKKETKRDDAPPTANRMIAKTLYGLEEILADEIEAIGGDVKSVGNRSVVFTGDRAVLYKSNIYCRTATRVLVMLAEFDAPDKDKLYDAVRTINWSKYFSPSHTIAVDSVVNYSSFDNSLYVAQRVKDGIVDYFRDTQGTRPSVDIKNPDIRINIHIHKDNATLSLDSSGIPLSKRGYRLEGGPAPLNESLAAGLILLSEWDGKINFMDAMCGSGTIAIEAAMIARNIPPGLIRTNYCFKQWKKYDKKLYERIITEARGNVVENLSTEIVGSDISSRIIKEAKGNAQRAGLGNDIKFVCRPIDKAYPPDAPGMMIINPPYGERIEIEDLEGFYKMIGDTLKEKYDGYDACIFTGNLDAAKQVGLRPSRKIKLFNPPLECRLLKYAIYKGSRKAKYRKD